MKNKDRSGHTDRGNKLIEENIQSSSRSRLKQYIQYYMLVVNLVVVATKYLVDYMVLVHR